MSKKIPVEKIKKMFIEASLKLQKGDAQAAKRGLEKVVKLAPDSPQIHYNLGMAYQHLGQDHKAVTSYQKVLKLTPDNVDAIINMGLAQSALGQLDQARTTAEQALNAVPNHPRALNLIGTVQAESNDPEQAIKYFEQSLASEANNPDAIFNLANATYTIGSSEKALKILEPLLQHPERGHLELTTQILIDLKRFNEAGEILTGLKKDYPNDMDIKVLGLTFREQINDHFTVIDEAQELLKMAPKNPKLWNSLGNAYFQLDSSEKAQDCYSKAIELDADDAELHNNMGLAHASIGNRDNAEACYRKSIALNPDYIESYRNLVSMMKFKNIDEPDAQTILELWRKEDHNELTRSRLAFAVGKIYDDCGLYDEAFAAYDIGNCLHNNTITMDFDQYFSHIDRMIEVFTKHPPQSVLTNNSDTQPIFILGMPRSGTTLVEQIISRHPTVTGCGELPCIERAITRLEKKGEKAKIYPDDFPNIALDKLRPETAEYFDWVGHLHKINTAYFTDKMPFNFVHIWLIKALFPHAAIVHCHRHPLDVITSNYFQLYGSDINFVYNLEILAKYYIRYQRLMRHWHQLFDENLYRVEYENLVSNHEAESRMLIQEIGLEWDDSCLDPKHSGTAVRTASIWQVRQGIYTSSKERWRRYEKHLKPAIDILIEAKVLNNDYEYIT